MLKIVENNDQNKLIEEARRGSRQAMGELFEKYDLKVRGLIISILGSKEYVDDVSQEVFINVFRSIAKFKGQSDFATWLHKVTVNQTLTFLRKKKSHRAVYLESMDTISSTGGQYQTYETKTYARELYKVLETMSPKRRVAFALFEIEQFSMEEIARITSTNIPTVKSRLFFARKEFHKKSLANPVLKELFDDGIDNFEKKRVSI